MSAVPSSPAASHLNFFASFIEKELGIVYEAANYYQLESRLKEICKNLEIEDVATLYSKAQAQGITGNFKQMLLDVATNNETSFFRDPKVFKCIEDYLIPELKKNNPATIVFRIWSAASSFGQEPYTLAMLLNEMKAKDPSLPNFEIWTTDISKAALERAKTGRYSQLEVQRGLPPLLLIKYFEKDADNYWTLKNDIRSKVRFEEMNLLKMDKVVGHFDFVLCRNVLIYQNEERKKKIIANIADRIKKGGFLILGASESLINLSDAFEQIVTGGAVLYRKK